MRRIFGAAAALFLFAGTAGAQGVSIPGILSLTTSCGVSGGPVNGGGAGSLSYSVLTDAQVGTSYSVPTSDCGKGATQSNSSASAWTLPAPATAGNGWFLDVIDLGAGTLTLTPASGLINGGSNLALTTKQGVRIWTDGSNYFALQGTSSSGGGTPGGSSGQIQFNNSGSFGGFTASGDATINSGTGAVTLGTNVVSNAKFRQSAASSIVGNPTGSTANTTDIPLGSGLAFSSGSLVPFATDTVHSSGAFNVTNLAGQDDAATGAGTATLPTLNAGQTALLTNQLSANLTVNNGGNSSVSGLASSTLLCSDGFYGYSASANGVVNAYGFPGFSGAITANAVLKYANASGCPASSSIVDNGSGVVVGSATGGAQGAGTVNAVNLLVNGVPVGTGGNVSTSGTINTHGVGIWQSGTGLGSTATGASGIPLIGQGGSADPIFGTAAVAGGGTGATTLTAHGVLVGEGTSPIAATSAGTAGQCLTSNGASADPTFQSCGTGTVTSITPGAGLASTNTGGTSAITTSGTLFANALYFPFYLGGLTLSNDGTSPNTVIDIAAGAAASDDTTTGVLMQTAAVTKTTGAWTLGTGNGCLDTGSVAASTWYHVFLIERTDTGVVDVLCSTSASSPTFPTSYTKKRRIGSIKTDGSSNIITFVQRGNVFWLKTAVLDVNTSTLGTTAALQTLGSVPTGVVVQPICRYTIANTANSVLLTSPDVIDVAPGTATPFGSAPGFDQLDTTLTAGDQNATCPMITTNTSGQIRARASAASTTLAIVTQGWVD